jgi:aspartyl-tRNA(Asn)/glutamyl-tRNA(Gln) amidotransferase subunit A
MALAPSLDTIGLLARSVEVLRAVAGHVAELPEAEAITRVAVISDAIAACEPAVRRAVDDGVAALAACQVTLTPVDAMAAIDAIDRHALIVLQGEAARQHRARLDDPALDRSLRRRLAKGLDIEDRDLQQSREARPVLAADFIEQVLRGAQAAALPVMAIRTPPADECDPGSERFSPKTLYALSRLSRFVNMLGFPALALPVGFDDRGMPVALQVVGPPGSDLALLDLGRRLQTATDWHGRIPTAIADLALAVCLPVHSSQRAERGPPTVYRVTARAAGERGATLPVVAGSGFGAGFDAGRWPCVRCWPAGSAPASG